ncbi:MAG: DUF4347 domain-containing protein [Methyloglobulus sp.]|nr:DUF4347 domain-containing protein [Methyloglobulus sp.]
MVVDSRAQGIHELLVNPPANTQIRVLDADRDGYQQIAEILQDRDNTADVHIMSASVGGKPWLGSSQIAEHISAEDSEALSDWGNDLAKGAKITFHGEKPPVGNN